MVWKLCSKTRQYMLLSKYEIWCLPSVAGRNLKFDFEPVCSACTELLILEPDFVPIQQSNPSLFECIPLIKILLLAWRFISFKRSGINNNFSSALLRLYRGSEGNYFRASWHENSNFTHTWFRRKRSLRECNKCKGEKYELEYFYRPTSGQKKRKDKT